MFQIQSLLCQKHPNEEIMVVNASEGCPQDSRLACIKCLSHTNDTKHFVSIKSFFSDIGETIKVANLGGKDSCAILHFYINNFGSELIRYQSCLIQALTELLNFVRMGIPSNLKCVEGNLKDIGALRKILSDDLNAVKKKWSQVAGITNYHESKEWGELEALTNKYILRCHNNQNKDLDKLITTLNVKRKEMKEQQTSMQNVQNNVISNLNNIIQVFKLIQLTETPYILELFPTGKFRYEILQRIPKQTSINLIFKGSRDGMKKKEFISKCQYLESTLMICKSKSGYIFGGYRACKLILYDTTKTSFIFSVTRSEIYPHKDYTTKYIDGRFGFGQDLCFSQDFQDGSSELNVNYSTKGYNIIDNQTHLMGGTKPNLVEIEVYSFDE